MSLPLLWELPGGKLEPEEDPIECIHRETFEELCLKIRILDRFPHVDRTFRDKHYRMIPYLCELAGGKMQVIEHAQATWQPIERLFELAWAPAEEMVLRRWMEFQEQTAESTLEAIATH
jgi:8-oxo-dGTP diphosphatase